MNKCLILLSLFSYAAVGQDQIGLFDTAFSPKIEAEVNKLTYERSEDSKSPVGDFSFKKFTFINEIAQVTLDNSSHFYDTKAYYNGEMIGFQGPAARFVYKLRDEDKAFVEKIDWLIAEDAYFLMDENEISLKGNKYAQKSPEAFILASNFTLDCERHPNHLLNDGDGFLSGCLNSGVAKPMSGSGIGTEYHYYDETRKKIIDIKGFINGIETSQSEFKVNAISADGNFSDEISLTGTDIKIACKKPADLLSVGVEEFVIPCLKEIEGEANVLDVKYLEDGDEMTLTSPKVKSVGEDFSLSLQRMKFQTKDSNFSLSAADIKCKTPEGLDILEVETYLKGCLNGAVANPIGNRLVYEFNQKEEGNDPFELRMNGDMGRVEFTNDKILLNSDQTEVAIDDEIFLTLKEADLKCQKEEGLEKFEAVSLLDYCKKDLELDTEDFKIKDFADPTKPLVSTVKVERGGAIARNNVLNLNINEIRLADQEDLTLMKDLDANCDLLEHTDVFIPNDIIEACSKRGKITVKNLFTEDSTLSVSQIKSTSFDLDKVIIPQKKAKISNIDIETANGKIYIKVGIRVLGIKSSVSFSGTVQWHKEIERLDIKVENAKLPLGMKSKGILMFFLKKMLVAEMIEYKKGDKIEISL